MKESSIIKFWLLIIFCVLHVYIYPQQGTEILKDSTLRFQGISPSLNLNYKFDDLILNNNPDFLISNLPLYNDSSTIWLRTELALSSSFLFVEKEDEQHFTLALHQKYLEDIKFDPVRYVLGMAQLGAVAYLA
ncbi:MAG: hypothetical protein KJO12_07070 [Ignavibacteria bacterium]|nr:hypothetical protein [Ignavibacteria bacterium]